jgi:anti-sigma B factor antagonist
MSEYTIVFEPAEGAGWFPVIGQLTARWDRVTSFAAGCRRTPVTGWDRIGPAMDQIQPPSLGIRVLPMQAGIARVRVIGEVDLCTAPLLEQALVRELDAASELLLDLSEVSFLDSSGLHAIGSAARTARANGPMLIVDSPLPAQARRVIEITGLEELLHVG